MSPEDRAMASGVTVPPLLFAQSFLRAQDDPEKAQAFDAVVPAALSGTEAIAAGFAHARAAGWLEDLCVTCIADRIVARSFLAPAALQTAAPGLVAAQARIEAGTPFLDTILQAQGLIRAAEFVCRIEVDGSHRGTGFLVAPDIVMTAGHVITPPEGNDPLVDATGKVAPDAGSRIEVLFGDRIEMISGRRRRTPPRRFALAPEWLLGRSAPDLDPANLVKAPVADYALIRLAGAPLLRPDALGLAEEEPFAQDPLLILQHPKGKPLCHAQGAVDAPDGVSHFFTHTVNTEDGSSGGPCLSPDFRVIGIHQGNVVNRKLNQAQSIGPPAAVLRALAPAASAPGYAQTLLLASGQRRLVVGRHETQDWLRASLGPAGTRILAVSPAPGRKAGMTFTADLIEGLLPRDQHRVLRLSAEQFRAEDPQAFGIRLLAAAGAPPGPATGAPDADTTLESWLRRVHVPGLLRQLDTLRGGRLVWLVLDDLRLTLVEGNGLRETLDLIYEAAATTDWLRVVLLGYGTTPPPAATATFQRIDLPPIAPADLASAFHARLDALPDRILAAQIRSSCDSFLQFLTKIDADARLDFAAQTVGNFLGQVP